MSTCSTHFDTPIGSCAIAWGPNGIVGVCLPETGDSGAPSTRPARFADAIPTTPPPGVAEVIRRITGLLSGVHDSLEDVPLDFTGIPAFNQRVYMAARLIPPGRTITYGDISARLKAPGTARAVGQALGANPFPIIVPCHRILGAGGRAGGFTAPGGVDTKMKILNIERAALPPEEGQLFPGLPLALPVRRTRRR